MADDMAWLHCHTTLSPGDGYGSVEDHVKAVGALGHSAMCVTEHGNNSSHVKLEVATKDSGVKPIFGCELYCETGDERGQYKHHLTVMAMNQTGYANLNRVVSQSWKDFKYKPTTTGASLTEYNEGIIALSGCLGGRLATSMFGGKGEAEHSADLRAGGRVAAQMREVFGDRYYLEVMAHPTLDRQVALNTALASLSKKMKIPLVVTGDTHYPLISDRDMYPLLHAIDRGGNRATLEAASQGWEAQIALTYRRAVVVRRELMSCGLSRAESWAAVANTLEVADRCNVVLPKLETLTFPGELPSEELFDRWLKEGWRYRGLGRLSREDRRRYLRRVKREAGLIKSKGFVDYLLVIADMVKWAKDNGIPVGPARGSAAASLVCWLLRITEVDPMPWPAMMFERFVDPNRHDLPDIDLDFDDEHRWRIRDYLVRKYGADRVGNIGTFTMYRGKNSMEAVARVHQIPPYAIDVVKEMLVERSGGDLRLNSSLEDTRAMFPKVDAVFQEYPQLEYAMRLEGNIARFSVHAAGLVVANEPLTNSVAVYQRYTPKGELQGEVLSIDKYDAEHINALKIDALGLTTMGAIRHTLELIGMSLEELYRIPLDDPEVFDGFCRGEVVGLFQFDGRATRTVNEQVQPRTFMDLADINALSRPGPLHSGASAEYFMVRQGKKRPERFSDEYDDIVESTEYQILYQEQIIRTVQTLGGFSWEEAAKVRKLISKKQGEAAFNAMQAKFMSGCAERDVDEVVAARIWRQIVTSGAYAFNAAHSISYAMLGYWCMWLKQHYPLEFYCGSLRRYDPKTKGFDLLKEAVKRGIEILPPDPRLSQATWTVEGQSLRAGFVQIPGIGGVMAPKMVEWRDALASKAFLSWSKFEDISGIGPATVDMIKEFCADEDPFGVYRLTEQLNKVRAWLRKNADANGLFRAPHRSIDVPYEPGAGEYYWIGVIKERNPKDLVEQHRSRTGEELDLATVKQPQYLDWCTLIGEDETGPLTLTVHRFDGLYERYKDMVWNMDLSQDLLLVRGHKRRLYNRNLYVADMHVLRMK